MSGPDRGPRAAKTLAGATRWLLSLIALSGCSPYLYGPEIKAFTSGVTDVAEYRTVLLQGEQADRNRRDQVIGTIEGRTRFEAQDCDLLPDEQGRCQVVDLVQQEREREQRTKAETLLANAEKDLPPPNAASPPAAAADAADVCLTPPGAAELAGARVPALSRERRQAQIFAALANYAEALAAVTNAADRQAFDAAASKLATAAGGLAGTLAAAAGPAGLAVGPIATAAVKLVGFIEGTVLDQRRYQTLRNSVLAACVPVRVLSTVAGLILANHRTHRLTDDAQTTTALLTARGSRYGDLRTRLALGQETAAVIESLRPDPLEITRAMRKLHDKLVLDVVSDQGQSLAFITELSAFADDAKALRNALRPAPATAP